MKTYNVNETTIRLMLSEAFKSGYDLPFDMLEQEITYIMDKYLAKNYTDYELELIKNVIKDM